MPDASGTGLRFRIGFDIGGTFTDFILHDSASGRIRRISPAAARWMKLQLRWPNIPPDW